MAWVLPKKRIFYSPGPEGVSWQRNCWQRLHSIRAPRARRLAASQTDMVHGYFNESLRFIFRYFFMAPEWREDLVIFWPCVRKQEVALKRSNENWTRLAPSTWPAPLHACICACTDAKGVAFNCSSTRSRRTGSKHVVTGYYTIAWPLLKMFTFRFRANHYKQAESIN